MLIARHDGSRLDVYDTLLDALGLELSQDNREKPPCCDQDNRPPVNEETLNTLSEALRRAARQRR